ncbi:MAG: aldehyde dehydrogenase family protein [Desulfovibrio sp.]|jgi:aldehyde dehydrogenase (NAD+)|nr:aldehyde dehydrogenase family protein [Desulfovibrio sp.]
MNYGRLIQKQREYFMSGATLPRAAREDVLRRFGRAISGRRESIIKALHADIGKSEGESLMLEIGPVMDGLRHTLENLGRWMRPATVPSPPPLQPGISRVYCEPLGVALIMAPWNYPFQLCFLPLLTAVSAGNCVLLKPSPETPRVVEVMRECLEAVFPPHYVALAEGGVSEAAALLRLRFDAILYTGSARVGRIIMRAAARHLTPVCLELGGKSPVLVMKDADLPLAAKRTAWGKILNAGQTCIAPDYVMADEKVRDEFTGLLNKFFTEMLGPDPLGNPDYARIISEAAFERLAAMAPAGTRTDKAARKMAPTAFAADAGHPSMREEIFGPLLPVLSFNKAEDALESIRAQEKPLAFYVFTEDKAFARRALSRVSSGGACVNDVLLHAASADMPFGGVGGSGMGRYHGRRGFEFFSNIKSVLHQSTGVDALFRYPPFSPETMAMLRGPGC